MQERRFSWLKWLGVIPGVVAAVLSISGLIGAHAVLAYRVDVVEEDVVADHTRMNEVCERLARIEGKLDILLDRESER
jgi:hypothetical protein